jgi:hypothetical protein
MVPSKSFTWHELPALLGTLLVDGHMEKKLANVQESMYPLMATRDYDVRGPGIVRRVFPASVFTHDLSALFTELRHIAEVMRPLERCRILTDSLCSIALYILGKLRIRLTLWCMNVNNCDGACARTELR